MQPPRALLGARGRRCAPRLLAGLIALATLAVPPDVAGAQQYFGQNRVRWERFDVRVLSTPAFDFHYPAATEPTVRDMARKAERWAARLSVVLDHQLRARKPIVLYANHPDFQQSTLATETLSEGTRGFAEPIRDRIVMPLSGVAAENDHVLGHEIVHLFQYDIAERTTGGASSLFALPLWFVEGMAEYLTLGRDDPNTAMWVRAGLANDRLPTIEQLTTDRSFFPYRFGHAFWAYVAGVEGDRAVGELFRAALRSGIDGAIREVLGTTSAELSRAWHAQIAVDYVQAAQQRQYPEAVATQLPGVERLGGMLLSPQLSPDGTRLAGLARTGIFGLDLVLLDVGTGRVDRTLAGPSNDPHGDALAFLYTSGAWHPEGHEFAHVVIRQGDHAVVITDVATGARRRTLRLSGVQSISGLAWAPDGRRLAIAGTSNGQPDLFLHDLASRVTTRVTNDAVAELQPTWSPDGRYVAVATDEPPRADVDALRPLPLRLALIDPVSGRARALPTFAGSRMSNPQFSADGRSLFFLSDRGGVTDLFRLQLATGDITQLTRLVSGISGITERSPAMTVAARAGTLAFTTFDGRDYAPYLLDPSQVEEQAPVAAADGDGLGTLSPVAADVGDIVEPYLDDAESGLPTFNANAFRATRYRPQFGIEGVGRPAIGVASGPTGAAVGGGASVFFGDLLGRQRIGVAVQAQGTLRDVGGQLFYQNTASRWTWFASGGRTPFVTASSGSSTGTATVGGQVRPATLVENVVQRVFNDQAAVGAQYPFSPTMRLELSLLGTRQSSELEVDQRLVVGGRQIDARRQRLAGDVLTFGQSAIALVGDRSVFGPTSPIRGTRWRAEIATSIGDVNFGTVLLDARHYRWIRPVTFAIRALHFGRYGRDAESPRLQPLLVGQSALVRGYRPETFTFEECAQGGGPAGSCPVLERLVGSRMAVTSAEVRIPLAGVERFSLLGIGLPPIELAPFVDAGVAWTSREGPAWRAGAGSAFARTPVVSTGAALRVNLGALIIETYWARPLQRDRGGVFGINLAPGW
ncbi:MAG: BamA/TamA family outer membrane protein [Gemmatimonadaceae bacterium]|nr:BamA/TamA family outer membrane protein [Gemmatimonadaceae bacterium]